MMSRRTPLFCMLLLMCLLQIICSLPTKDVDRINNEIGVVIDKRGMETLKNTLKEISPHADKLFTNIIERLKRDDTSNSNEGDVKISEKQVREALKNLENSVANNENSEVIDQVKTSLQKFKREYEKRIRRQERSEVSGKGPAVVINNEGTKMLKSVVPSLPSVGVHVTGWQNKSRTENTQSNGGSIAISEKTVKAVLGALETVMPGFVPAIEAKIPRAPSGPRHVSPRKRRAVGLHVKGEESKSHTSSSESNGGSITISENTVRDVLKALTRIAQGVFKTDLLQRLFGLPGTREKRFSEVVEKKQGSPIVLLINTVSMNTAIETGTSNTPTISISHSTLMGTMQLIPIVLAMLQSCKDGSGQTPLIQDIQAVSGGRYKGDVGYYVFTKSNIYFLTKPDVCTDAKRVLISELTGEVDKFPEVDAAFRVSGRDLKDYVYLVIHKASECGQTCNDVDDPVCGTDGRTYPNACKLEIATCESGGKVEEKCKEGCPCVGTKCTNTYPVPHNRTGPRWGLYGIASKLFDSATNDTCLDWCSEDTKCRSVKKSINDGGKHYCVKYNISAQELKDTGRDNEIDTETNTILWPTHITYDRHCDVKSVLNAEFDDCPNNCSQEENKVCGNKQDTEVFVLFWNECHMNVMACRDKTYYHKVDLFKCQSSSDEVDAYEVWMIKQEPSGVSRRVAVTNSSFMFPMEDYVWGHITSITALNETTMLLIGDVKCKEHHKCPKTNTEGAFYKIEHGHNPFQFIDFMDIRGDRKMPGYVDAFRFIEKDVSSGAMESLLIYNGGASLGTLSSDELFMPHRREQVPPHPNSVMADGVPPNPKPVKAFEVSPNYYSLMPGGVPPNYQVVFPGVVPPNYNALTPVGISDPYAGVPGGYSNLYPIPGGISDPYAAMAFKVPPISNMIWLVEFPPIPKLLRLLKFPPIPNLLRLLKFPPIPNLLRLLKFPPIPNLLRLLKFPPITMLLCQV